jgi:putative hydrolase of the HAD superfamily
MLAQCGRNTNVFSQGEDKRPNRGGDPKDNPRPSSPIKALFLDIGGVLLTNGWDLHMRRRAADTFGLDYEEMNDRHHMTFDTYEVGKLGLDEYLRRIVFYEPRPFTPDEFRTYMFAQSAPHIEMIELVRQLRERYGLKVAAVSNEGRELTVYRIREFALDEIIDYFISSCFVHFRKPDVDMYRIALDIGQVAPEQAVYIEDRPMFVEVAQSLGIHGIRHTGYRFTCEALKAFGLELDAEPD